MKSLTTEDLDHFCTKALNPGHSWNAARALGGLAPWWLRTEALKLAAAQDDDSAAAFYTRPRRLSDTRGSCGILFVANSGLQLLRPGYLLPLVWRSGVDDSAFLPAALSRLAEHVRSDLAGTESVAERKWGLHLSPDDEVDQLDLRGLRLDDDHAASGWAALAAGLIALAEGSSAEPLVLATGIWQPAQTAAGPSALQRVGGLKEKVHFACEYGATHLFVPQGQTDEANDLRDGCGNTSLKIGLIERKATPGEALKLLLARLEVPPDVDADLGERCDYYVRQDPRDRGSATAYYRRALLKPITDRCRKTLAQSHASGFSGLVTFVSHNWETVPLAVGATGVSNCLLLYTDETKKDGSLEQAIKTADEVAPHCKVVPRRIVATGDVDGLAAEIRSAMAVMSGSLSPERIVLDLTPGSKIMTLAALRAAAPKNWLLYLTHQYANRDTRRPGTEAYLLFEAERFFEPPRQAALI